MGIADDLQKLEQLRAVGTLTDEEFALAKTRLLTTEQESKTVDVAKILGDQLIELRCQNEEARIDREWEIERRKFQVMGRHGILSTPTLGRGVTIVLAAVIFGAIWIAVAIMLIQIANKMVVDGILSSILKASLPWLGVLFMVVSIFNVISLARGIFCCARAVQYNEAYRRYRERCENALSAR